MRGGSLLRHGPALPRSPHTPRATIADYGRAMDQVAQVRPLDRALTRQPDERDETLPGDERPPGASRLLLEVGADGARLSELSERLGLDPGTLRRLVRRLGDGGLVEVVRDPDDGRRRVIRLTPAGYVEWQLLDRRSDAGAEGELTEGLARADPSARAARVRFDTVDPTSPTAIESLTAYAAELEQRFPTGFLGAGTLTAGLDAFTPPGGTFVVATSDGDTIGCGGVAALGGATGELKRMWIDRPWRGLGLGRRLLSELEDRARALGHQRLVLDTNRTLTEAIALYESAGFDPVERYNDNPDAQAWFAKQLVEAPR